MKTKNQHHFVVVGALVIGTVLGILGIVAWRVFDMKSSAPTKSEKSDVTNMAQPVKSVNEIGSAATTKPKVKERIYKLDTIGVTFSCPQEWEEIFTFPNGIALKSPDYRSEQGFKGISRGSSLTVSSDVTASSDTKEALLSLARLVANGEPTSAKFITVAGQNAIEFTHSSGENKNQHLVVLFVKDGKQYTIEQQFKLDGENPYPDLMDGVVAGFKLNG